MPRFLSSPLRNFPHAAHLSRHPFPHARPALLDGSVSARHSFGVLRCHQFPRAIRCAPRAKNAALGNYSQAAFSSLLLLSALCVPALGFLFPANPEPATHASAPSPQGLSTDSPPPAGQPPSSTTGHSSCRHTHSTAPGRAASPSPRASLRALSLPQTWP